MEMPMLYKTIMLQLLEQHPRRYEQLRSQRMLLTALDQYASELRTRHLAWKEHLSQTRPDSNDSQLASEALELALHDMQTLLLCESVPDESEAFSLDEAMAFLSRPSPPA
jgi:hypothetical protein